MNGNSDTFSLFTRGHGPKYIKTDVFGGLNQLLPCCVSKIRHPAKTVFLSRSTLRTFVRHQSSLKGILGEQPSKAAALYYERDYQEQELLRAGWTTV